VRTYGAYLVKCEASHEVFILLVCLKYCKITKNGLTSGLKKKLHRPKITIRYKKIIKSVLQYPVVAYERVEHEKL
jgi:hypothetical protein